MPTSTMHAQERWVFRCTSCEGAVADDLPPLWTGMDCWPECCGALMELMQPAEGPIVLRPSRQKRRFVPRKVLDTAIGSYCGLDLLSRHVPGPLSELGIDQHVRLFDRLGAMAAFCAHTGLPGVF